MASQRKGLKRKSKDFIYELDDHELSPDDNYDDTPTKVQKMIKSPAETLSELCAPNLKTTSNSESLQDKGTAIDSKLENISTINIAPTSGLDASESENSEKNNDKHQEHTNIIKDIMEVKENSNIQNCDLSAAEKEDELNESVIEIDDSDTNASIEEITETNPIMEITDEDIIMPPHAAQEEGEVLEVFEIVDEVGPSPRKDENKVTESNTEFVMDISFQSEEVKTLYENNIVTFLETFPEFNVCSSDLCIHVSKKLEEPSNHTDIPNQKTPKKKHKKKKAKKELFVLDTNPSSNDSRNMDVRYSSKFIIEEEKLEQAEMKQKVSLVQTCFNCSQNHALKDCQVPRDYNRINAARQKFTSNKNKLTRYHVDEEQKFAHLKPGIISGNLRKALGLRKNELPTYIYGMRAMGYPPGWLEEAKIVHSSLNMFDIDGGKLKRDKKKSKGLNPDKIVEYPGFNAPLGKGFHDEFRKYNVPAYSKNLEKKFMLKHFEQTCEQESNSESSDMDLDENVEKCETQTAIIKVQKVLEKGASSATSTSLTELEQKKKELINQLNESSLNLLKDEAISKSEKDKSDKNDADAVPIIAVKSTALGTPILKSSSPYSHLPKADNFTVGVSPVIDYENLPNATGKYEQMSGVLNKVRITLKNLESCRS